MPASLIVLNGASSAGKSSIARALQGIWPRPLLVTGIDTFIGGWPESFWSMPDGDGVPGPPTTGIRVVPGSGPAPSWIPEFGEDFRTLMRLVHHAWASIRDGGLDQVIDHALIDRSMRACARELFHDAYWVGVTCDIDELVRREASRGDRPVGFASGTSAVVHDEMVYDLVVDTSAARSEDLARRIFDGVSARDADRRSHGHRVTGPR
jgi:chloramphenicol 3-O phosphotransferase